MEVVPLKNLFFLAVLKLYVKGSFTTTKRLKGWVFPCNINLLYICKHCLECFLLIQTLPNMYFRVNLNMKKPTSCCCFTWTAFIELNFKVAFLLIRKTWNGRFVGKVGGEDGGFWEMGRGDPSNWGMILKWDGGLILLYRLW